MALLRPPCKAVEKTRVNHPHLRVVEAPHEGDEWQGAEVQVTQDVYVSSRLLKRGERFIVHRRWQDQVFVRLSAGQFGPPLIGAVP